MGILKDTIKSAMGADQVNNGFGNGPKLPFMNSNQGRPQTQDRYDGRIYSRNAAPDPRDTQDQWHGDLPPRYDDCYDTSSYRNSRERSRSRYLSGYQSNNGYSNHEDLSYYDEDYGRQQYRDQVNYSSGSRNSDRGFRPIILPQIDYGDGQPFMRAYSPELLQYNISEQTLIETIDALNVAMVPNPENQIFQKAMGIAGWFV